METNIIYNEDCISGMNCVPDNSIDVVCTDPPYLYLKNQKLDRDFDEAAFFAQIKRVLKKDGFIVMFGRGTSFYRWNTSLADLGFTFKEEFIRLTGAADEQEILVASERIILCERKEDSTRITYRVYGKPQGFGESLMDCRILFVRETVYEINALIYR